MTVAILWLTMVVASFHSDRKRRLELMIGTAILMAVAWWGGHSIVA